jgi:Anti-sigma-K factor rskA, C-terminal
VNTAAMNDAYAEYLEHGTDEHGHGRGRALSPGSRAELDALRQQLADDATWAEPPADLGERVLRRVRAARRETVGAIPHVGRRHHPGRIRSLAAAAAVLIVATLAVVLATRDPAREGGIALAGTELAPAAHGTATIDETASGLAIEMRISGLPPAPPGHYYEAWMIGAAGSVPIGTFHARATPHGHGGTIVLWSGVDPADYPVIRVTIQREGAGSQSSGRVALSGRLAH